MNEPKFTPGPWKSRFEEEEFYVDSFDDNGHSLCICEIYSMDTCMESDCDLIAAAPELYKSLLAFCQNFANDDPDPREIQDIYENAVGVLAQARGEVMW